MPLLTLDHCPPPSTLSPSNARPAQSPIVGAEAEAVQAKYLSPVFKVDEAAHAALLVEAASVDARIKGDEAALRLEDAEAGGDVEAA